MSDRAQLRGIMSPAIQVGWLTMLLLAIGVAGYAGAVLMVPELRPPLVQTLFAERLTATVAHFLGGAIALVAGALQVNPLLRARFLQGHRWAGRVYVVAVLTGGVAGLALAIQSMGGFIARAGFALLAVAWLISTSLAYRHIRRRELPAHRRWMTRSYALTLAAVTLRIYLPASLIAGIPVTLAYPAIAWLCWVPNLLVAEWLLSRTRAQDHRARISHQ
jgi:uncharacterized membrane protein